MTGRTGVAKSPRFATHSNSVLYRPAPAANPGIWHKQLNTQAHWRKLFLQSARPHGASPASSPDALPGTVLGSAAGCGQIPQAKRLRHIPLGRIILRRDGLYGMIRAYSMG